MKQPDMILTDEKSNDTIQFSDTAPLAARIRPRSFDEYIGQTHILGEGKLLRRAVEADRFTSIILYGPPGVGKTSLAELIALNSDSTFIRLSGINASVRDVRDEIANAITRKAMKKKNTVLFIDEIHRFNKAQQDSLLPDVEAGNIRLIGATTYNPQFYVIEALMSRSLLFRLEGLSEEEIKMVIDRAITHKDGLCDRNVELTDEAVNFLCNICEGDARRVLNALEIAASTTPMNKLCKTAIDLKIAESSVQQRLISYGDDGHYDTASAFIKSMRGSDADAAIYWLAKMLHAGEDIRFIARRLVIFASEDIGNADPQALMITNSAMDAVERIGMPESRIILAQATTYCATAPKSNASYMAVDMALKDVKDERLRPIPMHLRDAHYKGAKDMGHGVGYKYPHDSENNFVVQDYMGIKKRYYTPVKTGYEAKISERIAYWDALRKDGSGDKE